VFDNLEGNRSRARKLRRASAGAGVILRLGRRYGPANLLWLNNTGHAARCGFLHPPALLPLNYAAFFRFCRVALLAALTLAAGACASDKSYLSHKLNNIAARDNGFFLAREKLAEVEATLYKGRVNDYNRTLPLYPTLDSGTVRASRADLNDIIKKASLPIQHRPGSDWTDDAYLLVGWARLYKMEFDDAVLTFKYVNSTSKDDFAKQAALIGLLRTFLVTKQLDNAKAVSDLLEKETGLPKDARELFLARADYYLQTGEPAQVIAQLERAVPLIEAKNERSRTRFILAQLYQQAGQDKEATAQLNQILNRNPPYELDFESKLLLGQVSDLRDPKNQARLDKYFAGLLKDPKNKEYRDKIYYEMGRVQYRLQHYADALTLLGKSARVGGPSRSQKGYTYLLAGRIYYENLQKYPLAAVYYDSTAQAMPKDNPLYAAIQERAGILKEFAKNYVIIQTQDSMQALARLPEPELSARLNRYAAAALETKRLAEVKAAAQQKALAQQREQQSRAGAGSAGMGVGGSSLASQPSALSGTQRDISNPNAFDPSNAGAAGGLWYFDNPGTLSSARTDFIRLWGDRKLQDNWRTVSAPNTAGGAAAPPVAGQPGDNGGNPGGAGSSGKPGDPAATTTAIDPAAAQRDLVAVYRQSLPDSPPRLEASDRLIEGALYALGGIYKEQLREVQRGFDTYAAQVVRYPRGAHAADAYYLLYLHFKALPDPARAAEYATALQREFPTSTYARFLADPLYREHERALHVAVAARLDATFGLYKDQFFTKARAAVAELEAAYPKHDLLDRVAYLKLLLALRTQPPTAARASVALFIKGFPDSPLAAQARTLAAAYQKADAGQLAGALASTEAPRVSQFRPGEVDNRLRILYGADEPAVPLPPPTSAADPKANPTNPAEKPKTPPAPPEQPKPTPKAAAAPVSPAPAAGAAGPEPASAAGKQPAASTASGTTASPAAPADKPAVAAPAAVAYATQLNAAHAVVLLYPAGQAPLADLPAQLGAYNGRLFRADNLSVVPAQALGAGQEAVVVRALPGAKAARTYAARLRAPQSPLGRLRGQGYQVLLISLANLSLLQQSGGDVAAYQQFYEQVYPK